MVTEAVRDMQGNCTSRLSTWAIVTVKQLADSKRRMSAALGSRREEFAYWLAIRTFDVLGRAPEFAGLIVVTPDPRVSKEARLRGAHVVSDTGQCLNTAWSLGMRAARERCAEVCVLIPADLALLTPDATSGIISRYLASRDRLGPSTVGLVRCKNGTGTNMVLTDPREPFEPAFGPDSFATHVARLNGRAHEFMAEQVAFDVDTREDFARLARSVAASPATDEDPVARFVREICRSQRTRSPSYGDESDALLDRPLPELVKRAILLRDAGHPELVTYSRKVFLPLTQLCRDSCHYCTFAKAPRRVAAPFMELEAAVEVAARGAQLGCKEALFTLGERPEARYGVARDWLAERGFASTLHYLAHVAAVVRDRTGLLPHINAGCMNADEFAMLRPVSASMGLMLESASERLCERGGPHFGSPDKKPLVRLETIAEAGRQRIPFTTGILIGIGETRRERIEALLAIRTLHERYGHIQEIIVQNFVPKVGTRMANAPAPAVDELIWTIAVARVLFGAQMSIQAPPNLSPAELTKLVAAGINDWGGVSPLTPDYVNPESPWPEIERLREQTAAAGKVLAERLTIYPGYAKAPERWLDPGMRRSVLEQSDAAALGREDSWRTGRSVDLPASFAALPGGSSRTSPIARLVDEIALNGSESLDVESIARLFDARGPDFRYVCAAADHLRATVNREVATYVVNRNINYTNICAYRCTFCGFSKGPRKHAGAEKPYLLDLAEIAHRVREATNRGATEVCLQGGIHPSFTGETYLEILRAVRAAAPTMHVHAFSPLEVTHGATTLGMTLGDYLAMLRDNGLGSLPGTAAEILHDPVRAILCPDKLTTDEWLEVVGTAHEIGLSTTATIMFGHVDAYRDWAIHLTRLREQQRRSGGFTEFVPLPFVAYEAPLYRRGQARPGPTLREALLMHAVARLVLHPWFRNIQTSWVKMGPAGMRAALMAGANDMGGVLMNESITRAAGATHGQEMCATEMRALAESLGREAVQRTTLYGRPKPAFDVVAPGPGAQELVAAHVNEC
jgi:FO synthase